MTAHSVTRRPQWARAVRSRSPHLPERWPRVILQALASAGAPARPGPPIGDRRSSPAAAPPRIGLRWTRSTPSLSRSPHTSSDLPLHSALIFASQLTPRELLAEPPSPCRVAGRSRKSMTPPRPRRSVPSISPPGRPGSRPRSGRGARSRRPRGSRRSRRRPLVADMNRDPEPGRVLRGFRDIFPRAAPHVATTAGLPYRLGAVLTKGITCRPGFGFSSSFCLS
jgi:hypothetical protein